MTTITNREEALEKVKQSGNSLKDVDEKLKADREIVLEAVRNNGFSIKYADDTLKSDREVVLEAVKTYGLALEHAGKSLQKDREIVLEAVKHSDGYDSALEYTDDSLKVDREVALEAITGQDNHAAISFIDNLSQEVSDIWLNEHGSNGSLSEYSLDMYRNDMEEVQEGHKIIIIFCAITRWIRNEKELKNKTWNKAYTLIEPLVFEGHNKEVNHPETEDGYFKSAIRFGTLLANAYFLEGKTAAFRSFIKSLGTFELYEEINDLALILLILCRFVENNEDIDVSQKYMEDIEHICRHQLDIEAYEEILEMANRFSID